MYRDSDHEAVVKFVVSRNLLGYKHCKKTWWNGIVISVADSNCHYILVTVTKWRSLLPQISPSFLQCSYVSPCTHSYMWDTIINVSIGWQVKLLVKIYWQKEALHGCELHMQIESNSCFIKFKYFSIAHSKGSGFLPILMTWLSKLINASTQHATCTS